MSQDDCNSLISSLGSVLRKLFLVFLLLYNCRWQSPLARKVSLRHEYVCSIFSSKISDIMLFHGKKEGPVRRAPSGALDQNVYQPEHT